MSQLKISSYVEAVQLINEVGILPLAPLIPNHPSLYRNTLDEQWLTGTEADPWLWRTRLPSDGAAAYWKSISFETTEYWMENVGILHSYRCVVLAIKELKTCLTGKCSVEAFGFLNRLFQLDS